MQTTLTLNGREVTVDAPAGTTLLEALRDDLGLTGARHGCGLGQCGACFVLVDGEARPSCSMSLEQAAARRVVTVEGLADGARLHRVQRAFIEEDAMQCGYCTSGMIVAATALLARVARPSDEQIREALAGNLCRCGVYGRIVRAVRRAAEAAQ
jgi:aerobic-type carbon monoxide dehydrogenase small subunit (CoxS/CutS family)